MDIQVERQIFHTHKGLLSLLQERFFKINRDGGIYIQGDNPLILASVIMLAIYR